MKSLIVAALTLVSLNSFASQLPDSFLAPSVLVKEIVSRGNLMPGPGRVGRVFTEVTFTVSTCRSVSEADYKLVSRIERNGNTYVTLLKIEYKNGVFADCFGPVHETDITLGTSEISSHSSIKLLNPLLRTTHYVH